MGPRRNVVMMMLRSLLDPHANRMRMSEAHDRISPVPDPQNPAFSNRVFIAHCPPDERILSTERKQLGKRYFRNAGEIFYVVVIFMQHSYMRAKAIGRPQGTGRKGKTPSADGVSQNDVVKFEEIFNPG